MPVTTAHDEYNEAVAKWKLMRDVLAGEQSVKNASEEYLPKPAGRTTDDFSAYKLRAQFFDATAKTADGMLGAIFRKEPVMSLPTALEYLLEDADGKGNPLAQVAKDGAAEVLGLGRLGFLVDMPTVPEEKRLDEERNMNAQARLCAYSAENIINWRYQRVGSVYKLSRVVLREDIDEVSETDEFETVAKTQYRVLQLDTKGETIGAYRVRLFREEEQGGGTDKTTHFVEMENYEPKLPNGNRLDFIPFAFAGSSDNTATVDKPALLDVANVNLSHYRNSADYEDALFMVGQPTPVITGLDKQFIQEKSGSFTIGSRLAWFLPKDTNAFLLESKSDLGALSNALEQKEKQMVALGAKLIEAQRSGVEAAETIKIRQSGEASILSSIAQNITRAMNEALTWLSLWMNGTGEDFEFACNQDFFPERLSPEQIKELVATWQAGGITFATVFENLVAGEIIADGTELEEYEAELETEKAKMPAAELEGDPIDENDDEDDDDDENENE